MTAAQKKQLLIIEHEFEDVCFERQNYTHDNSAPGFARWQELWDRGEELWSRREKLVKEIARAETSNVVVASNSTEPVMGETK